MKRPDARLLWRAWWPGLALIAIGVIGYLSLLDAVREQDDLWRLDTPLLEWFAAHRTPGLTDFMVFVSWVFGPVVLPILVALGGAVWGWRTGQWFNVAVVVGAEAFAGLLSLVLKATVDRPRPPEEYWQEPGGTHTASFPSGHTLCSATLVLVTGFLAWRVERSVKVLVWWAVASRCAHRDRGAQPPLPWLSLPHRRYCGRVCGRVCAGNRGWHCALHDQRAGASAIQANCRSQLSAGSACARWNSLMPGSAGIGGSVDSTTK